VLTFFIAGLLSICALSTGGSVYPAQVLTDLVNGEVVGVSAVYDKSVSTGELRSALNTLYDKWSFFGSPTMIWRFEPEQLVVQLSDRDDEQNE
jgi:hypothetical protein